MYEKYKKETTTNRENKQKFNYNLRENTVNAVKPYSALKIFSIEPSLNANKGVWDISLMRIFFKLTKKEKSKNK